MRDLKTWLAGHWVVAAGFMAAALLAVLPLLHAAYALPLVLIFLHSPGYMLHQVEEHAGDRFRTFVNQRVFGGRNALSVAAILVINIPVVWGLNLAALYAACLWGAGFGLVAPYAMLVNGVTHIGAAAHFRSYNPGFGRSEGHDREVRQRRVAALADRAGSERRGGEQGVSALKFGCDTHRTNAPTWNPRDDSRNLDKRSE